MIVNVRVAECRHRENLMGVATDDCGGTFVMKKIPMTDGSAGSSVVFLVVVIDLFRFSKDEQDKVANS